MTTKTDPVSYRLDDMPRLVSPNPGEAGVQLTARAAGGQQRFRIIPIISSGGWDIGRLLPEAITGSVAQMWVDSRWVAPDSPLYARVDQRLMTISVSDQPL